MSIKIRHIETYPLRAVVGSTPTSSLGAMAGRNGLLVRIEDDEGTYGWGEVWCNFPPHAPVARAHLIDDVIAPHLLDRSFLSFNDVRPWLEKQFRRMAIHTGEPGAFSHCIAGLDLAILDLAGRRSGIPVSALLADEGEKIPSRIRVYASSPDPQRLEPLLGQIVDAGHAAIKLKVAFNLEHDAGVVAKARSSVPEKMDLMLDANQAWTLDEAIAAIDLLKAHRILFYEEPLLAIEPPGTWATLARKTGAALAAGENVPDEAGFAELVKARGVQFIQPDVAKWGGLTGTLAAGRQARAAGVTVSPHFMGTAVGLAASLHLLAATGGAGRVELDANPNPLRTDFAPALDLRVTDGTVSLPTGPGLGVEPDPDALHRYGIRH
jgi:L-alanine-DL-glutamate epimerase-like enolase superfamily enzyme